VLSTAALLFPATAASAATPIVNGDFESGNLTGWTSTGTTAAVNSGAHGGTYAARVGSTSPSGTSSLAQTFTAPSGATQLSFWYSMTCPDTVTYDWATVTLRDNTTGTTTTPLPRTCTTGAGWKQVTASVSAAHAYTLTLTSRDDNYPGDPSYTLYDDVTVNGTAPVDDFSISANPGSATVTAGQTATSTISTAVTAGSAQTVSLTATGAPTGASVTLSPTSVSAGNSATLTVTTSATTPSGSYPIMVTGTGPSATHSTTFTLTVGSTGGPALVSTDPFTNTSSQHATEVEPDTFAWGTTIVSSSQVGRFTDGGGSDISWNTSTDGGATWAHGMLPGITTYQGGGAWARVSDPAVAYDAKHGTWLISGLVINANVGGAGVSISRSANGTSWQNPVIAVGNDGQDYDKEWVVCDDTATSPFYGNCYVEVDVTTTGNTIVMSTSTDGGATWSAARSPSGSPSGLGGQPLVQPNGTVVVPYSANGSAIRSFTSTNGGSSWNAGTLIANVSDHAPAGGLRGGEGLPSAEVDAAGTVYVAWQDCRFRSGCPANDIVYSTSSNGTSWSAVTRVPIDATTSGIDHFIPGLGIDRTTSGAGTHIGLYYYFYPTANCTSATCRLTVGYVSSVNGGSTWSTPQTVGGPMSLSQIASTTQGSMVGDYMSCSIANGKAVAIFAVGKAPGNGQAFDEAMYTAGGLAVTGGSVRARTGNPTAPLVASSPAGRPLTRR
jgi:hypothetical protein